MELNAKGEPRLSSKENRLEPKFRQLTAKQIVKVVDLLKEKLKPYGDVWVYDKGWDDEAIMKEAVPEFPGRSQAVSRLRRECFGPIVSPKQVVPRNNVERLARCERILMALCQQLGVSPDEI